MNKLQRHICDEVKNQLLLTNRGQLIVACSGGKDSMALCHVLLQLNQPFTIAHVNFELRGEESNRDEKFVEHFAREHNIPFCLFRPQQSGFLRNEKEGTQEWARRVRYAWFDGLLQEGKGDFILLAHHKLDQAETILHQFFRGGGVASLTGMESLNGKLLRPMLHVSKAEINAWVNEKKIAWCEDSSNATVDYTRNYLRHEVLPRLEQINPDLVDSLSKRAIWFREADVLAKEMMEVAIANNIVQVDGRWYVPVDWLKEFSAPHLLMWQLLEPHGFVPSQVEDALGLLDAESGRFIQAKSARLWKDRTNLILSVEQAESDTISINLEGAPFTIQSPISLQGEWVSDSALPDNPQVLLLDMNNREWPLCIRTWREGDTFRPLGMDGHKKVSDFLIQQKIPMMDKKKVMVLCSGDVILWVIGMRVSEDARLTKKSGQVLKLTFGS